MRSIIMIGGKEIPIDYSADTPRRYREEFGSDLIIDMQRMRKDFDTGILENLAYTMARAADPEMELSIHEWLAQFDSVTAIYAAGPKILEAWTKNVRTSSESKKK